MVLAHCVCLKGCDVQHDAGYRAYLKIFNLDAAIPCQLGPSSRRVASKAYCLADALPSQEVNELGLAFVATRLCH